jgi:hypothetical protein
MQCKRSRRGRRRGGKKEGRGNGGKGERGRHNRRARGEVEVEGGVLWLWRADVMGMSCAVARGKDMNSPVTGTAVLIPVLHCSMHYIRYISVFFFLLFPS